MIQAASRLPLRCMRFPCDRTPPFSGDESMCVPASMSEAQLCRVLRVMAPNTLEAAVNALEVQCFGVQGVIPDHGPQLGRKFSEQQ